MGRADKKRGEGNQTPHPHVPELDWKGKEKVKRRKKEAFNKCMTAAGKAVAAAKK
jgi:hypothetical protein